MTMNFYSKRENQNDTEWNLKEKCSESEVQNNPSCMENVEETEHSDIPEIKTAMDNTNDIWDLEEDSTNLSTISNFYPVIVDREPFIAYSSIENNEIANNEINEDYVNDIEKNRKNPEEVEEPTEGTSENTDYLEALKEAREASNNFDMIEFSKHLWKTVFYFTKAFYSKHFEFGVRDKNIEEMYKTLCVGLDGAGAAVIMRSWVDAHWNYTMCNQKNFFISRADMTDIIERFEESIDLIENADFKKIEKCFDKKKNNLNIYT